MQDELAKLKLKPGEKAALPLGFSEIFVKKILPEAIEHKLTFYSEKYQKVDLAATHANKPISKILTLK